MIYGTAWKEDHTARLVSMAIDAGFRRLLDDVEKLELVRRAVLPAWQVLEGEIK